MAVLERQEQVRSGLHAIGSSSSCLSLANSFSEVDVRVAILASQWVFLVLQ